MLLRTANAAWFELLTAREELASALRCLAATGRVELQSHSDLSAAHLLPTLRTAVDEYRRLAQRYENYWPAALRAATDQQREPEEIPRAALSQLHAWAAAADPFIVSLQQLAHESSELEQLQALLSQPGAALPNLQLFGHAGPMLASRAYLLAPETDALGIPPAVLAQRIDCGDRTFLLSVGPNQQIAALDESLNARKARRLELPDFLPALGDAALAKVQARAAQIADQSRQLQSQLAELSRVHGLSAALADLAFVEWLVDHVPEFTITEHFVWITGWTSDSSAGRLEAALQDANVHALLRFSEPPSDITRPIVLRNPRWVQPFELFARLLGVPAANEADPSLLLALMTPLMFGFMFGDVGQGAVLVIAGVVLRRKYPATALLIPGGIAAMVFGALFGSVFAREDILPALWLRPMARPLTVLGVSLAGGCGVILLGFILDAAQHYWEGHARRWWATRAGLVLCYLGMVASVRDLRALWLMPAGLAWYWIGDSAQAPSARARRLGASVGESLETLLQLFVNSLSFVRVGAFALAHAGLAAAVSALSATISSRPISILALALGNALLIIIEGLIVGIQTTRLVLFEFFIRFLRGTGRQFHPLQSPPATDTMQPSRKFL